MYLPRLQSDDGHLKETIPRSRYAFLSLPSPVCSPNFFQLRAFLTFFLFFAFSDPERCVLWAIYSNNMDFLKLPEKKILNKVICDFHFKENNFMNYKRERLTKTLAIPSIYITPETNEEVDLIENPTDWVTENKKMPLPASFSQSNRINLDSSADLFDEAVTVEAVEESPTKIAPIFKKRKIETSANTTVVRILNGAPGSSDISIQKIAKKLPTVTKTAPTTNVVKVSNGNYTIRHIPASSAPKIIKNEILTQPRPIEQEFIVPFSATDEPIEAVPVVQTAPAPSTSIVNMEELQPMLQQITEIKEMLNKRSLEVPPSPAPVKEEATNISQSQLNKVQLFNGIKRYLSPSMIALLRMELFTAPGREYKKDEKIICQELLQLGEDTYNFLNDEWRLRLPAKSSVQEWIESKMSEEDDDAS